MDIAKIDQNFAVKKYSDDGKIKFYGIPCQPFDLYGVFYEKETERFVRMPSEIAESVSDNVAYLNTNTAGGRIRFSTDAAEMAISVSYSDLTEMNHMPLTGSAGFSLLEETEKGFVHVRTFAPQHTAISEKDKYGFEQSCALKGGKMRNYILFFPLYNGVKSLFIGVSKNATVSHGKSYRNVKPILYYGSSITQGGCASRPDTCYQAIISKRNNADFINLGFSGSAKAEKEICEYLAKIGCSAFVCDYDHNAPDPEHLEKTHYVLYKTFRKSQPQTPVVFVSKPDVENDAFWQKRRKIIKDTYLHALSEGDNNVYFIDGSKFFDKDRDACTVDGTHPTDAGFFKMAAKIGAVLNGFLREGKNI
ncbi:MAG: hypothetical protein IJU83_02805 [Clostridia bacterium]|nr:hypothetical protein [Clostridia bacterium]